MPPPLSDVEVLTKDHDVSEFDCGTPALTEWLRRYALQSQQSNGAKVYVRHRQGRVAGYYALAAGSVAKADASARVGTGLGNYAVPVVVLARLAVDRSEQGQGLGTDLFRDALLRVNGAADIVGVRALLIHVQDEDAKRFYEQFDVEQSPTDPLHLFLLIKDLRAMPR